MYGARDIIVLVLVLGSLPICFFRPFYGIILWTVIAFLNPQAMSWGAARHFPVAEAVGIPTLVGAVLFCRMWGQFKSRELLLLMILWIWFTLTSLHTTFTPEFADHEHTTWLRWEFVSKVLLMTFVTVGVVNTWLRLRWLLLAIAGSFAFFTLKAIPWMLMSQSGSRLYGPGNSMISDNNDLGLALNMTLPLFFYLAKSESDKRMKWVMGTVFLVTIPCIFLTYSRGALVGLALVLFLMVMKSKQRLPLILALMLATMFALFLTPEKWRQRMDFAEQGRLVDASARSRFNSWTYSWRLALDYPLTGGGFEAFTPALFDKYAPNPRDVHGPHSIYFGVLAEHGFPGLILYLSLIVSCFLSLHQVRRQARFWGLEQAVNYSAMLHLSLVAFLASGAFLGRAYFDYFFTIVACTAVLKHLCQHELSERLAAEPETQEQVA